MENWNAKILLIVFLTGILISTGYAATEENVSKGYSDNAKDDAFYLEKEVREKYDDLVKRLIKSDISTGSCATSTERYTGHGPCSPRCTPSRT